MTVKCGYCAASIVLNPDSEMTRETRDDPAQQLRRHMLSHPFQAAHHARKCGWLLDALAFESNDEPDRWRKHILDLIEDCKTAGGLSK